MSTAMDNEIQYNSRTYTNIQGLSQLRAQYRKDPEGVTKEVAKQFESILMQMVLTSMRDANKAFSKDSLFGNDQMEMYQDMFDKQLSLLLSEGNQFAQTVEKTIDRMASHSVSNQADVSHNQPAIPVTTSQVKNNEIPHDPREKKQTPQYINPVELEPTGFASPEEFVKKLWTMAKTAASALGIHPEILLAQAALETNWGKNILQHSNGASTHNLFNIKAGDTWIKNTTSVESVEQKNGVLVKERSKFRSYDSFKESFLDFIHFLKQNGRYGDALSKVTDPGQFVQALQKAGYATDQNYADKILKIFSSPMFQNWVAKAKETA